MFIFPLIIVNIINSYKFINYFKEYNLINDYIQKQKIYSYMDSSVIIKDNNSIKVT